MEQQAPTLEIPASIWQKSKNFAKEIWNDHDFWVKALAIKGGAGAVVIAGVVAISHLIALPFLLAAGGIALCGGLIALGLYGAFLGAATIWDKLRSVYYKTFSDKPPEEKMTPDKSFHQKMAESPRLKALQENPFMKKFLNSRVWQATQRITKKQEDIFLAGLAMKGSIFSTVIGISMIATQVVVLPVIAVGSLLTFTTVAAVGAVMGGSYGIYLATRNIIDTLRSKKKTIKTIVEKDEAGAKPELQPQLSAPTLTPVFTDAGEKKDGKAETEPAVPSPSPANAPPPIP
jgi:hypothetical protein